MLYLIDVYGDGDSLIIVNVKNQRALHILLHAWKALDERMLNNTLAPGEKWVDIREFLHDHGIEEVAWEYIPL